MSIPTDDEYTAFEAWLRKRWGGSDRGELTRQSNGAGYVNGNVDFAFAAYRSGLAATPAPTVAAAMAATVPLDDHELVDLAHGANQEALSFGVGLDVFLRLAKTVRARCAKQAPVADQPAEPSPALPQFWKGDRVIYTNEHHVSTPAKVKRVETRWSEDRKPYHYCHIVCDGEKSPRIVPQSYISGAAPKGDSNG